jgi:hypothetical protein
MCLMVVKFAGAFSVDSIRSVLFLIDPVIRNGGVIDLYQNRLERQPR